MPSSAPARAQSGYFRPGALGAAAHQPRDRGVRRAATRRRDATPRRLAAPRRARAPRARCSMNARCVCVPLGAGTCVLNAGCRRAAERRAPPLQICERRAARGARAAARYASRRARRADPRRLTLASASPPPLTRARPSRRRSWAGYDPNKRAGLYPSEAASDFAFIPFGGGERKCVGDQFATLEVRARSTASAPPRIDRVVWSGMHICEFLIWGPI
jgi:hypothetical protein